jgi:hypothetical protein
MVMRESPPRIVFHPLQLYLLDILEVDLLEVVLIGEIEIVGGVDGIGLPACGSFARQRIGQFDRFYLVGLDAELGGNYMLFVYLGLEDVRDFSYWLARPISFYLITFIDRFFRCCVFSFALSFF